MNCRGPYPQCYEGVNQQQFQSVQKRLNPLKEHQSFFLHLLKAPSYLGLSVPLRCTLLR